MSRGSFPQIEDSIQDLSLQEQLKLLEWLVRTIRTQTIFEEDSVGTVQVDNGNTDLQETVARIKASPPNPAMVIQPTMTIEEVTTIWEADSPTDEDISPDEWDRLWIKFESDLKATDRANDIEEGRL